MINQEVLKFATDAERKYAEAFNQHGGARPAAKALGVHHSTVQRAITRLEKRAARGGCAPDNDLVHKSAPGFSVKFTTTMYDADGNVRVQWVRQNLDEQRAIDALKEAVEEIVETGSGRMDPLPAPRQCDDDIMAVYPLADLHVGMLAWAEETGENYDLKICEQMVYASIDRLVSSAPPASQALLINLGDFFHADNAQGKTEASGHHLDTDSRYSRMVRVGLRIKRWMIDRLLQKHDRLIVWTKAGNHDPQTLRVLAVCLEAIYENEPRISVSVDPAEYEVMTYGCSLIGAAHGHKNRGPASLPALMAAQWPREWGAATERHWYTGHVHHDSVKEYPGCIVETLRTLAPRDAYTAGAAYHSGRDIKCDVWHKTQGRIARLIQRAIMPVKE